MNTHESAYRGDLSRLNSRIVVCGAGALGSNFVDQITRIGASNLTVIDKDRIEESNISTQIWMKSEVGNLKTAALQSRVFKTTGVEIESIPKEFSSSNAKKFFKNAAIVVDVFDNNSSRKIVQAYCRASTIPCIHAGVSGDGYGEVVWDAEYKVPEDVSGDPCEVPFSRNLVMLTVTVLCEEVINYLLNARSRSWSITLKDLAIRPY